MPLKVFTQRNFVADFVFEKSPIFYTENEKIVAVEAPFGGLGAMYAVHLRLIGKLVGDFLLVIIELFSIGAFVLSQFTRVTDRQTDGRHYDHEDHTCIQCSAVKMKQITSRVGCVKSAGVNFNKLLFESDEEKLSFRIVES